MARNEACKFHFCWERICSSFQDGFVSCETEKQKKTNVSKMMIFYLKGNLTMKIFIFHIFEHKDIRIWHYRWKLAKGDDVKR
jgi:hypothetical protein